MAIASGEIEGGAICLVFPSSRKRHQSGQAISNTLEFCNVHCPADVFSTSICDQVGSNEPKPIYKLWN